MISETSQREEIFEREILAHILDDPSQVGPAPHWMYEGWLRPDSVARRALDSFGVPLDAGLLSSAKRNRRSSETDGLEQNG